jgi:flagellar hook-associated protein 1 FlgK
MAITTATQQGLEIGRRALHAQQAGLNVTSHNVANANTPGFSRRQVNLEHVVSGANGSVGVGADAASITRARDVFVDAQARVQQQVLGYWESLESKMSALEAVFTEPAGAGASETGTVFSEASGMGLSGSLSRFWNAWQDLANSPESGSARAVVRQEGEYLSASLRQYSAQLQESRTQLDQEVRDAVDEVNGILDQLGEINAQIPRARASANGAADLEDQRDLLVDKLSALVDASVTEQENGQITVLLGGHSLVERNGVVHLQVRQLAGDGLATSQIVYGDDHTPAAIGEGSLRGLVEVRDGVIPGLKGRLDELAAGMVTEINRTHRAGYGRDGSTGIDFFDPEKTSASNITLDQAVIDDLNNIAASGDGSPGDNGSALALAGLRDQRLLAGGTETIDEFYTGMLGEVGARSKEAQTMAENHRLFAQQIENRRQSVQGVSLNDEAAQLVLFQRAYQAAARTVSVVDDMLEVLINM